MDKKKSFKRKDNVIFFEMLLQPRRCLSFFPPFFSISAFPLTEGILNSAQSVRIVHETVDINFTGTYDTLMSLIGLAF